MNTISPMRTEGVPNFLAQRRGLNTKFVTRRQVVMNRHFTEIISDVLSNSMKNDFSDLGITITSIETKAWNKGVDVFYYVDDGFAQDKHQQLKALIQHLSASVTERRLIGRTPVINFVLDRSIEVDKKLEDAMKKAESLQKVPTPNQLVKTVKSSLKTNRNYTETSSNLTPHMFSAPKDMTNSIFGLDYETLYNHAASQLERGRALSTRTRPSDNVILSAPPIIKGPPINTEEEDPIRRIVNMQKFLINQKKKTERLGRMRRLEEILARDANRWEYPINDHDEYTG